VLLKTNIKYLSYIDIDVSQLSSLAYRNFTMTCDLNVSISRAKKKLIIVGSFDMMADGHGDRTRSKTNYAHNLAKLVESKYGKVMEVPQI
jgi:hypothetical protein